MPASEQPWTNRSDEEMQVIARLLKRTAHRNITKQKLCNGNVETLRNTFSRDSIIVWHFTSFRKKRDAGRRLMTDATAPPVVRLRRPHEFTKMVESLKTR